MSRDSHSARDLPTVGVSDLAAVAQQVAWPGERMLVCMDARMGEVYWCGVYDVHAAALVDAVQRDERVDAAADGRSLTGVTLSSPGPAFARYPQLRAGLGCRQRSRMLPQASEIALLAEPELARRPRLARCTGRARVSARPGRVRQETVYHTQSGP